VTAHGSCGGGVSKDEIGMRSLGSPWRWLAMVAWTTTHETLL